MNETAKSAALRTTLGDFDRWLIGNGLDVGCGPDPLKAPRAKVRGWDLRDGDAQLLQGVEAETFDFVYSSHCLEHMRDVAEALRNWLRVTRPGGCVYVVVPEWTLYEHRQWPSLHNHDHKASFALIAAARPLDHPHYTTDDMRRIGLAAGGVLIEARLEMEGFDFSKHSLRAPFHDQTMGTALAQACFIYRKL